MKIRNLLGSFAITALITSGAILPTHAVSTTTANYTPIDGTTATFEKYFVMNSGLQIPNATFKFAVSAGTAVAPDATHSKIMAGVGTPTIADVTFSATDTADVKTTGDVGTSGALATGKQFVNKTATVDFSSCNFTEPGIYRYVITETSTVTGVTNDSAKIMDVFVTDNNGTLELSGYVMHQNADSIELHDTDAQYKLADKVDGFVNNYESADLVFGKEVAGNQGNKYKDFTFTLKITNATPNAKYAINYTGTAEGRQDTPTSGEVSVLATDGDGSATRTFKLHDGEYVTVKGLANGVKYALTEDAQDYVSTEGITAQVSGGDAYTDATTGTIANNTTVKTGFTNTKAGVIPTGIFLGTMPYVAVVLAGGGMAFLVAKKKKED